MCSRKSGSRGGSLMLPMPIKHHLPDAASAPWPVLDPAPGFLNRRPIQEQPDIPAVRLAQDPGDELVFGGTISAREGAVQLGDRRAQIPQEIGHRIRGEEARRGRRQHRGILACCAQEVLQAYRSPRASAVMARRSSTPGASSSLLAVTWIASLITQTKLPLTEISSGAMSPHESAIGGLEMFFQQRR